LVFCELVIVKLLELEGRTSLTRPALYVITVGGRQLSPVDDRGPSFSRAGFSWGVQFMRMIMEPERRIGCRLA